MAMDNVRTETSELAKEPHKGFGQRSFAENEDGDTFSLKLFAKSTKVAVSDHRNIVSMLSLKATELSYENLRSAHLKTVDNVNDLHAKRRVNSIAEKNKSLNSNLHNTNCSAYSQLRANVILTQLQILKTTVSSQADRIVTERAYLTDQRQFSRGVVRYE
jgi:hypothetical protein